jgi:hypothetical protein
MLHAVVEGEPGIFPDPVARLLRGIGGLFRRGEDRADEARAEPPRAESDEPPSPDWEPERPPDAPPRDA